MNILFVEDNAMNRMVVGAMLRAADLVMAEAESGEIALAMIEANTYDLVLMDLRMPGMDGLTVIGKIRSRPDEKAKVPIIVVTADAAVDLYETCIESGADGLILKPVSMDVLFDSIGSILAAKSPHSALI